MTRHMPRRYLSLAIALACSGNALAQSGSPALEEVLVTAQKRSQSLQDVPVAVTAFDAETLQRQRINRVTDLTLFAPNVEIIDTPSSTTAATIAIRGASQINPAVTWENSVGIYLDGVFIGKNLGAVFDVVDLERVEVLRGPQGTLYGKNTVGGAVNLITRKPSGELGGSVQAEMGNNGIWALRGTVDTPEVAGLKATATVMTRERDGFYDNEPDPFGNPFAGAPSGSEFQSQQSDAARLAVQWDINDSWVANYSFDYSDQDNDPRLGQLTQTSLNSFLSSGGLQDAYLTSEDDRADEASNDWAFYERAESSGHALDVTWSGDNMQVRSITAYRQMDFEDLIDIDGTPVDVFHSGREVEYDAFSQELQLSGSLNQLDYLVGLFYFKEDADVFNPITFFGAFGLPTANNRYGLEAESVAAFGQVDWRPAAFDDRLTVTLGLRWTEEEKDQYVDQPGNYSAQADDTFNNTSPALALAYAVSDDVNVYGRVARGWKSGGFNGEASSEQRFVNAYDDEDVTAYEIGVKSRMLDGRLQVNAAVFYNDIENFQLSVFEGAAAASLVENVPEFVTSGFELEAIAQVSENLRVNLSYGYLDAEYEEFSNDFTLFDKDDAGVPYSPENSLSVGLDWSIARTSYGEWDLHADYSYRDDYTPFIDPDQVQASQIESRSLLNARLALRDIPLGGGTMTVALWGQNILDEEYRINTIPFGGVDQRVAPNGGSGVGWTASYFGDPRTYGVEVRYDF